MADQYTQEQLANMSDEDLLNLDPSALGFNSEEPAEDADKTEPDLSEADDASRQDLNADEDHNNDKEDGGDNGEDAGNEKEAQQDGDPEASKDGDEPSGDDVDPVPAAKADAPKGKEAPKDQPADAKPTGTAPATPAAGGPDALKSFHDKITAPFKANGKDMQVKDADEAIQLMQMGAGYAKKMAALKPNLTLMKSLQKADLLSEEKINFLIDLMAKKPEAISKLVQDSGVDPLDLTADKAGEYRPGNHRITDEEQALDEVFEQLNDAPGFDRTLKVVTEQWDAKSRDLIAKHPKALQDITSHIAAGVFDEVQAKVDRERTFGRLTGLSDLEAYRQVGLAMMESGELEHLMGKANPSSQQAAPAKVVEESKPQKADDSKRREQRKAAAPTRASAPSGKTKVNLNPLEMSDEEIAKLDISAFS